MFFPSFKRKEDKNKFMNYYKNYDKKEILLDPNFKSENGEGWPENWLENDRIKQLGSEEYPIDKKYKIINL